MTQPIKLLPAPRYLIKRSPANIVLAYEKDLQSAGSTNKRSASKSSRAKNNAKYRDGRERPFAAKVKRRWSDAKSKVRKRLGLYTRLEPAAIGLYIDMVI